MSKNTYMYNNNRERSADKNLLRNPKHANGPPPFALKTNRYSRVVHIYIYETQKPIILLLLPRQYNTMLSSRSAEQNIFVGKTVNIRPADRMRLVRCCTSVINYYIIVLALQYDRDREEGNRSCGSGPPGTTGCRKNAVPKLI